MKSNLRAASSFAVFAAILGLLMLTACGNRAENQSANTNSSPAPKDQSSTVQDNRTPAAISQATVQTATDTTRSQVNNRAKLQTTPQAKIGSGGNDLFLFTQARAALDTDEELRDSNIVIDVKDGSLTLQGTVAKPTLRFKAEQLVIAIKGVKAVNNRLRISTGNAKPAPSGR